MRQTCSCAAAGDPPGRTNDFSGASSALTSSQAPLQPRRLLGREPQARAVAAVGHGDVRADVEQVVLDPAQERGEALGHVRQRERDAELRVELVDRPVGLDPRMRLRHPAHVAEVGLPVVAEARVDAGQVHGHGALATVTSRPFRVGGQGSRCESGADPPL